MTRLGLTMVGKSSPGLLLDVFRRWHCLLQKPENISPERPNIILLLDFSPYLTAARFFNQANLAKSSVLALDDRSYKGLYLIFSWSSTLNLVFGLKCQKTL